MIKVTEFTPKKELLDMAYTPKANHKEPQPKPPGKQKVAKPPVTNAAIQIAQCDKPKAPKKSGHSEKSIQRALAHHYDWNTNDIFFGVNFGGGIADVLMITRARVCVEIEIKISLSDWNADQGKDKWKSRDRKKVGRFYYAVPTHLLAKIPEWVPITHGVLGIREDGTVVTVREAPLLTKYRATVRDYAPLVRSIYWRYMHDHVPGMPLAKPLDCN